MPSTRRTIVGCAAVAALLLLLSAFSAEGGKLTLYAAQGTFHLDVVEREGTLYVVLPDALARLGELAVKRDERKWKLQFGKVEGELSEGSAEARFGRVRVGLAAPVVEQEGKPLVPMASLAQLLARFTGKQASYHGASRRIFVGDVATRFTAELTAGAPPALVLTFSAPVNPVIATEPGKLKMVFTREPVISTAETFQFTDKQIASASYSESNGRAELAVNGTVPLMAAFSNGGKTITITPAPVAVATTPPPGPVAAPTDSPKAEPPQPAEPAAAVTMPAATPRPRFLVAIDAGHGGDERGATIGDLAEKDITLALARRLRAELQARGIATLMLREADSSISFDQRAEAVNRARATAYVAVHAAGQGTGVRVYTSVLRAAPEAAAELTPWEAVQTRHLAHSRVLADAVAAELTRKRLFAGTLPAPVRPLNNVAAAAIVVEVAGQGNQPLTSVAYQQSVSAAVAAAVEAARPRLEAR